MSSEPCNSPRVNEIYTSYASLLQKDGDQNRTATSKVGTAASTEAVQASIDLPSKAPASS
jgi:hypothetical protein